MSDKVFEAGTRTAHCVLPDDVFYHTRPSPYHQQAFPFAPDMVNHPPHYTAGGAETIDFIEAKALGYHLGNVVKYISRAGKKDPATYLADLKKAQWYLSRAIRQAETASSPVPGSSASK